MHCLHYKKLPSALIGYCQLPVHRYSTRYTTSRNYVLPNLTTNRGQCSIKFSGPKAWAKVPDEHKEIAFQKPFSKKLKEHILETIFVDLPQKRTKHNKKDTEENLDSLRALFESENEEDEFHGFDNDLNNELRALFESEDEENTFFGFDTTNSVNLTLIFQEDSDGEEFFGF